MLVSWTLLENSKARWYRQCLGQNGINRTLEDTCQLGNARNCSKYSGTALKKGCSEYMNFTKVTLETDIEYKLLKMDLVNPRLLWQIFGLQTPQEYVKCLRSFQHTSRLCIQKLKDICEKTNIKATKIIRTTMDVMEDLIKIHPKNIYIIHQLRDPRGTIVSRSKDNRLLIPGDLKREAKLLCSKMLYDVRIRRRLEKKYPGVFLTTHYESLADAPMHMLNVIYKHTGLVVPSNVERWIKDNTAASQDSGENL